MSRPLQQKNTRILFNWLPLVMLGGSVFFYFLMRGHILHMQEQQLQLKQNNIARAFRATDGWLPLHIPGEYDIVPEGSPGPPARDRPRDTIFHIPGSTSETVSMLTGRFSDKGRSWLITTYISSREVTHLIIKIAFAQALIFALLLLAVVVVNRKMSSRLWAPFYATMNSIRRYDIRNHEPLPLSGDTG